MKLNIGNIPGALVYFFVGVLLNIISYYIFSPDQVGLLAIMEEIFTMDTTTTSIIFMGLMTISIFVNLLYPIWMVME